MLNLRGVFQDLIRYPSLAGTIVVNAVPILGFLVWGWGVGALVLLYWLENVVVGGVTLLRMISSGLASGAGALALIFVLPFFIFHYGLFCFVHGIFVMLFFAGAQGATNVVDSPISLFNVALHAAPGMPLILGVVAAWRLVLFATQFLLRGDFAKSNPMTEMMRPYGRIITLHLAIFAGAFAMFALGQPTWGMFALIALKTVFDFVGVRKDAQGSEFSDAALKTNEAFKQLEDKLQERWPRAGKKPPAA